MRKLTAQAQAKQDEIDVLEQKDPADLWIEDLDVRCNEGGVGM